MRGLELRPIEELSYVILKIKDKQIYWLDEKGIIIVSNIENKLDYNKAENGVIYVANFNKKPILDVLLNKRPEENKVYAERNRLIWDAADTTHTMKVICSKRDIDFEDKFRDRQENFYHMPNQQEKAMALYKKVYNKESKTPIHARYDAFKSMLGDIKEGDTLATMQEYLRDIERYYNKEKTYSGYKYSKEKGISRYITKINRPIICRDPENSKENTFDLIKVEVNLIDKEDRFKYINRHKKELIDTVIVNLSKQKTYIRYGVPIEFLRCTRIHTLTPTVLEVIFELKEIKEV